MAKFRIKGGELRSVNPMVVRYRSGTGVELKLDGTSAGYYADGGSVRIGVAATSGSQTGPTLPRVTFSYGTKYTELSFTGAATWSVDGDSLVVESAGTLTVVEGASTLPATQAELQGAAVLDWLCASGDPVPHRP